ncbi:exonuclease/endonuclease/phosphatase family protein [Mesomycoplasma neurolyticum]|uniref:Membrane nuclease MnuA n=1 Tax=Mesomycoplasma neurolyticum TaxID=2120 RepID=A0A449A4W3_9BACT|nr:hypothetical protein [Mesomycoplasma neurolyticum]VEU59330.1 Uncharacterised protein [Mesomycoplasma neurolyticum]
MKKRTKILLFLIFIIISPIIASGGYYLWNNYIVNKINDNPIKKTKNNTKKEKLQKSNVKVGMWNVYKLSANSKKEKYEALAKVILNQNLSLVGLTEIMGEKKRNDNLAIEFDINAKRAVDKIKNTLNDFDSEKDWDYVISSKLASNSKYQNQNETIAMLYKINYFEPIPFVGYENLDQTLLKHGYDKNNWLKKYNLKNEDELKNKILINNQYKNTLLKIYNNESDINKSYTEKQLLGINYINTPWVAQTNKNNKTIQYARSPFGVMWKSKIDNQTFTTVVAHLDAPKAQENRQEEKSEFSSSQGQHEVEEALKINDVMNFFDVLDGDNQNLIFLGDTNITEKVGPIVFEPLIKNGFKTGLDWNTKTSLGKQELYSNPYDRIFYKGQIFQDFGYFKEFAKINKSNIENGYFKKYQKVNSEISDHTLVYAILKLNN